MTALIGTGHSIDQKNDDVKVRFRPEGAGQHNIFAPWHGSRNEANLSSDNICYFTTVTKRAPVNWSFSSMSGA